MRDRLTPRHWVIVILCLGILAAAPLFASSGSGAVPAPVRIDAATTGAGQAGGVAPTITPHVYPRNLVWWPYATGPYYGDTAAVDQRPSDMLVTAVGTFRIGEKLPIPAELTNSLAGLDHGGQYFLVQMRPSALGQQFEQTLASMGAKIIGPVPVNGLVVKLDRAAYNMVAASPLLQYIEPFHAAYKLSPGIGRMPQLTPEAANSQQLSLRLTLFPGEPVAPIVETLKKLGLNVTGTMDGGFSTIDVSADPGKIPMLAKLESVANVAETAPNLLMGQRGALYIQSEKASVGDFVYWKAGLQGDGQIIEVTDSGMLVSAGDKTDTRAASNWTGGNPGNNAGPNVPADHRKVVAYINSNQVGCTGTCGDLNGCDSLANGGFTHGGLTSGIAAGNATRGFVNPTPGIPSPTDQTLAQNPNQTWARQFAPPSTNPAGFYSDFDNNKVFSESIDTAWDGVAKGAKIVFVDAGPSCPEAASPGVNPGSEYQNIVNTWNNYKAQIHNFSWGSSPASGTAPVYSAGANNIDQAIIDKPANLLVISAGNAGSISGGNGTSGAVGNVSNQATCKNCISAGASEDVSGLMFGFSSEGPGPGKRHVVTVLAEGLDNGCRHDGTDSQTATPSCIDTGYAQGTSFSAPNLAGAAAIMAEYFQQGFYPDGTDSNPGNANDKVNRVSGRLLRALMIAGTKPVNFRDDGAVFPKKRNNHASGYGQLFLTRVLPLASYSQTVPGLIVHDVPGDIDGDGTPDGVSNLSLPATASTTVGLVGSAEFQVLDTKNDLVAALTWDDPVDATVSGVLVNDLDLEITYCGANNVCGPAGSPDSDDIVWQGGTFTEDVNEDGTQTEPDLNGDGLTSNYWYTISNKDILTPRPATPGGTTNPGVPANYRDKRDNSEAVFIATSLNKPDLNADGTSDVEYLDATTGTGCSDTAPCPRTGKWMVAVFRRSGTTNALPFTVAIAGPVTAGSSVRFDTNPVTCNGSENVIVNETNDTSDPSCTGAATCPASLITSRTEIQVIAADGTTILDKETGGSSPNLIFSQPDTSALKFQLSTPFSVSTATPVWNDGILEGSDGATLKVFYNDVKTATVQTRTSVVSVDCSPQIDINQIRQIGPDAAFLLAGGCDGDRYLDVNEQFGISLQYYNVDAVELVNATASLRACTNGSYNAATDNCTLSPYVQIDSGTKSIGTLPSQTVQRTSFGFKVVGTPPARTKTDLLFCIKSDTSGQQKNSCTVFTVLQQADDEVFRYITDCPTGCTLDYDRNNDETWENYLKHHDEDQLDYLHAGLPEKSIVYSDMTVTSNCSGCGNAGFNGPWDFDANDKGFRTGKDSESKLTSSTTQISNWGEDQNWDGVLQSGEDGNLNGKLDQSWGTGGGCGWMSKASAATTGGIWHTGTIGTWTTAHSTGLCGTGTTRANDSVCEQYDLESGTAGTNYWAEFLRSPAIHPVHFGNSSGDGFDWKTRITDWSWNMQLDIADSKSRASWEFDLDLNNGTASNGIPMVLGDTYVSKVFGNQSGLITGGQLDLYGGAFVFAPTALNTGSGGGDETNGTKGNNRAGKRGCFFNNLNDIAGDGPGLLVSDRVTRLAQPEDDDCDNQYTLGPDQGPGVVGVDDDGNGVIDDLFEICPCKKCSGGPRANLPCTTDTFCSAGGTRFLCTNATNASGVPTPYGDDTCGNGSTDENVSASFGTSPSLRQIRNADTSFRNGVASGGRGSGNILFNNLEDFYGPAGKDWGTEIGFITNEGQSGDPPKTGYGIGVDDMVIEWEETHPVAQAGNNCTTANPKFNIDGSCASLTVGSIYNTTGGDRAVPVTVIDPVPNVNLGEAPCGADQVVLRANSSAELAGESFCLTRVAPGSNEFKGTVKVTTRINKSGDGYVYTAFNGLQLPGITLRYIDKDDGVAAHLWGNGPDTKPGIANFDDDGDGTVDNASEQCPLSTSLGPGRSPHLPGQPARYSDDTCGCANNPIQVNVTTAFDTADLVVSDVIVRDGIGGIGKGDGDGFADPKETVVLDVVVRNLSKFPLDNVELTMASNSPLVGCVLNDRILIPHLDKNLDPNSQVDTSTLSTHFSFIPASGTTRTGTADDFSSSWTISMRALAKAAPDSINSDGSVITVDLPIEGTAVVQTFKVIHNLSGSATRAADFVDNFQSYTNDAAAVCTPASGSSRCTTAPYVKRVTGDDRAELATTHCQINSPYNPNGNNADPVDYCELGEGYSNTENHWHLQGPKPTSGTTCERTAGCPDPRSHGTGNKSLASGQYSSYGSPFDNNITVPWNRMYWLKTRDTFQLGTGLALNGKTPVACTTPPCADQAPVLEYWTQLSDLDWRIFGDAPPWTFTSSLTYLCVDKNGNNDCDTSEDGLKDKSEKWEPLHAYFSPETSFRLNNFINCMYDPSDDGSTEDQFYQGALTLGPSSTCYPNSSDSCVGRTQADDPNGLMPVVLWSGCWPETGQEGVDGVPGATGGGKWVKRLYNLKAWRGQKILVRWHTSPGGLKGYSGCADGGPGCGNYDDGWFIDDLRIYGMASGTALAVDNTGFGGPADSCPTSQVGSVVARLAALPYPRNNKVDSKPLPAVACSDPTTFGCDYNNDSTLDTTSNIGGAGAAGQGFVLDASKTTGTCLGGAFEYQFVGSNTGIVRDYLTDPSANVNVAGTGTTFTVNVRCSSDLTNQKFTASVQLVTIPRITSVTHGNPPSQQQTTVSWISTQTDVKAVKGSLSSLVPSGSFAGATPLVAGSCLQATSATDTSSAPAGNGTYYVVGYGSAASWGDGTESQPRVITACP